MGRMSTRENKNCYQKRREELGLSRETASEMLCMSPDRLEKIENEKLPIRPEEVLAMSDAYKNPTLCNHYCSTECPIGKQYVPKIEVGSLPEIVLKTVASLNEMEERMDRLVAIGADGQITSDEIKDFVEIQKTLERISMSIETLQFWVETMVDNGSVDKEAYAAYMQSKN